MLAYILTDDNFEQIDKRIIINLSVDISNRKSPKNKVNRLMVQSTIVEEFKDLANIMIPLFNESESVCFGKDDFAAFNNSLREINEQQVTGFFYNVEEFIRTKAIDFPTNLRDIGEKLKIKHDVHNPISDSFVTLECFKHLLQFYQKKEMEYKIPSKNSAN